MAIRVGINGFGRIGRLAFRILTSRPDDFEVALINDVAEPQTLANLLKYDTTYGPFSEELVVEASRLIVNRRTVRLSQERDPAKIPWRDAGVDLVFEASGAFRTRGDLEKHLAAGASKVLLSAPGKGDDPVDATIVLGVNDHVLQPGMRLVSNASCTTNCVAPMVKVLHDRFGIVEGLMLTVHAYTSSQELVDGVNKDLRRARAAAQNIIPTTTGAAQLVGKVIPELEGKLTGLALRVPVSCGSVTDLTVTLLQRATKEAVNGAYCDAGDASMKGLLQYTQEPLVSSDIIRNPHSCILDGSWTQVQNSRLVKVLGWYDNEWGYASRCVDLLKRLAQTT